LALVRLTNLGVAHGEVLDRGSCGNDLTEVLVVERLRQFDDVLSDLHVNARAEIEHSDAVRAMKSSVNGRRERQPRNSLRS
jgi:hypothetical protein